jgi:hypothetical protein
VRLVNATMYKSVLLIVIIFVSCQATAKCLEMEVQFTPANIPVIELSLNSKHSKFIFDLGMKQALSLDAVEFSEELKNATLVKKTFMDAAGKVHESHSGLLHSMDVNGFNFTNLPVSKHTPWGLEFGEKDNLRASIPNVLGRDFFTKQKGYLLYSRDKHLIKWCTHLEDFQIKNLSRWYWIDLVDDEDGLHVHLEDNQRNSYNFIIDSAATLSLVKPNQRLNSQECDIDMNPLKCKKITSNLQLNSHTLHSAFFEYPLSNQLNADGILGDSFLQEVDILIDSSQRKVGLSLASTPLHPAASYIPKARQSAS